MNLRAHPLEQGADLTACCTTDFEQQKPPDLHSLQPQQPKQDDARRWKQQQRRDPKRAPIGTTAFEVKMVSNGLLQRCVVSCLSRSSGWASCHPCPWTVACRNGHPSPGTAKRANTSRREGRERNVRKGRARENIVTRAAGQAPSLWWQRIKSSKLGTPRRKLNLALEDATPAQQSKHTNDCPCPHPHSRLDPSPADGDVQQAQLPPAGAIGVSPLLNPPRPLTQFWRRQNTNHITQHNTTHTIRTHNIRRKPCPYSQPTC